MSGYNCLYVPGTDHAGIATQVVVEKRIKKLYNKTRHDYGRENFIKEVFKWKDEHGNIIYKQLRRTGAGLDWTRECFTMDDNLSKAVKEAFIQLHQKGKKKYNLGYIYRATRLVNWDCKLNTAISNIEVEKIELEKETWMNVGKNKNIIKSWK
jgi:valyl-tRNA synthetase